MFTTKKMLIAHTRQDIVFSQFCLWFFFAQCWKNNSSKPLWHNLCYDSSVYGTSFRYALSHPSTRPLHFLSFLDPSAYTCSFCKTFFCSSIYQYFVLQPKTHTNKMNVMNFLLTIFFSFSYFSLLFSHHKWMFIRKDKFIGNVTLSQV